MKMKASLISILPIVALFSFTLAQRDYDYRDGGNEIPEDGSFKNTSTEDNGANAGVNPVPRPTDDGKEEKPEPTPVSSQERPSTGPQQPLLPTEGSVVERATCPSGDALKDKVTWMMREKVAEKVSLPPVTRGNRMRLVLENGFLGMGRKQLLSEPTCLEEGHEGRMYNFLVEFTELSGAFDWKLLNLFGQNFNETALLMVDRLQSEFTFREERDADEGPKVNLEDVKIGNLENFNVKVNIPREVTSVRLANRALAYVVSRITTFIVNRSKDVVAKNMRNSFKQAIREKMGLKQ